MIKKTGADGYRPPGASKASDAKQKKASTSTQKKQSSRRALDSDFDL